MPTHPLDACYHLRERWKQGEPTYGGWIYLRDSFSAEVVARAGFDWVCVDTQHGTARAGDLVPLLQAVGITDTPAVVRVPWNDPGIIMNALDAGAAGVIIPMINSPAEALEAVAACRYPPAGIRSWGPARPSMGAPHYSSAWANERVLCVVMVETSAGADRVEEILAVPGIDAVFIGPTDLALSLGTDRDGEVNASRIAAIKLACAAAGVPTGTAATSIAEARRSAAAGFALIALASDAVLLTRACAELLAQVRQTV